MRHDDRIYTGGNTELARFLMERKTEGCPNAIFDTSITMTGEKCIYRIHDDFWETDDNVVRAFRQIGCERITFGSDYPFGNPARDIRRIESLALTDEEKQMILGENSRRLYFNQSDEPGGLTESFERTKPPSAVVRSPAD